MDSIILKYSKFLKEHINESSFKVLWANWNSSNRHYHNEKHLREVLNEIRKYSHRIPKMEYEQLIMAAFFHDAIYDPKSSLNEDQSIRFFYKSLKDLKRDWSLTESAIECTKKRRRPNQFLLRVFWEADNNIFLKGWSEYMEWEYSIRKEYLHVPEAKYKEGRTKFLQENLGIFGARADGHIKRLIDVINS